MFIIEQTIDLRRANPPMIYGQALEYGDKGAHEWRVRITSGGAAADLTGMTALLTFKRAAGPSELAQDPDVKVATVEYAAEVDAQAGVVSAEFDAACYGGVGNAAATIKLMDGGRTVTSAVLILQIARNTTDAVIDPTNLLPSIEELLAQMGVMQEATQEAQDAADAANEAAGRAPYIGENDNWYVWDAESGAYVDSGMSSKGEKGDPGANGTGSGTVTGVTVNGTTHEPDESGVVDLGDLGGGEGGTGVPDGGTAGQILIKQSDEDGDAAWQTPTAQTVGALPTDGTAADSAKLGGVAADQYALKTDVPESGGSADPLKIYPVGSIYMSTAATSPAELFGGAWEQLKDQFLLGAGDSYAAGAAGGEAVTALTVDQIAVHEHVGVYYKTSSKAYGITTYSPAGDESIYKIEYTTNSNGYYGSNAWTTGEAGGGAAHNNMPPYLAVYMWKRVS